VTTGTQIILLSGALVGLAIALVVWYLAPAQPDLADVVDRFSPEAVKARTTARDTFTALTTQDKLGLWALKRFPASWWGQTPTKELALLRISVQRHYGTKVLFAAVGLLVPPLLSYFLMVLGWPIPILIPVGGSIAMALVMFWLPDYNVRSDAKFARAEFARALGAYTDLVALERLGGTGSRQAMENAAQIGDNWVFQRLAEELARSSWAGVAPWDALNSLADELGLPELIDLADIMRLTSEGAQVYANLRARSQGLRSAMLNTELAKANASVERMSIPMTLLGVVFMAILVAPSIMRMMGG
jgi:hypothetical protein